jgi:hypothetical protein
MVDAAEMADDVIDEDDELQDDEDEFIPVQVVFSTAEAITAIEAGPDVPTVVERMVAAGISEDRARAYVSAGAVLVESERVSDPDAPAAPPSRVVLLPA